MTGALLAGLVPVLAAAPGFAAPGHSSVTALQDRIQADASRIHQLTSQFAAASTEAAALGQQLASQEEALRRLRAEEASSRLSLARAVLQRYTGAGAVSAVPSTAVESLVGNEYLAIASGNVSDRLDIYSLAERRVAAAIGLIRREEAAARSDAAAAAGDRGAALADAAAVQQELTRLQAVLASSSRAPATQGQPVHDGLVTVVKAQTSSPPTTTAPPPSTPPATAAPPKASPPKASPPPAPPPATAPPSGGNAGGVWLELRQCESGDNYRENTGNGYYGAYQFSQQTWTGLGYPGRPDLEPPAMQDAAAMKLQQEAGWGQWPACSAALGL